MITARSRNGLLGLGDLGMQVPMSPMQGPPEDSLITGLGRAFYRNGTMMGAGSIQRAGAIAPMIRPPATISTALRPPSYISPTPKLPVAPTPIPDTRVPTPTPAGTMVSAPPRIIAPSGSRYNTDWPQTSVSPVPVQPPVEFPKLPTSTIRPTTPYPTSDYVAPDGTAAGPQVMPNYYPGTEPGSAPPPVVEPTAGNLVDPGAGTTPAATGAGTAIVATNADGSQVQENGSIIDPATGAVTGTDYLQWAKYHKGAIGIGAAVIIGGIILAKVL